MDRGATNTGYWDRHLLRKGADKRFDGPEKKNARLRREKSRARQKGRKTCRARQTAMLLLRDVTGGGGALL